MIRIAAALAAACVLACAPQEEERVPAAGGPPIITGTYGRPPNVQVIIDVGPDDEYRARVGTAAVPVRYERASECHRLTFDLPDRNFTGCIGVHALVGRWLHRDGTIDRVYLARR